MKNYSFSTAALFPFETEDALRMIGQAGFENAELMPQAYSDVSDKSTLKFEKAGVHVSSVHYPLVMFGFLYTAHKTMIQDGRDYSRELLRMTSRLGAKVLVAHAHKPDKPEYREMMDAPILDNLRWLAEECAKSGTTLAMENSAKTCATAPELLEYIKLLGHDNVKPMVDINHVREAGGNPAEFLRQLNPCHLHLSDSGAAGYHLPPGSGDTDWLSVRSALDGYSGCYTVEPSRYYYLEDTISSMHRDLMFMQSVFEVIR